LACEWLKICAMTLTVIILVEIHKWTNGYWGQGLRPKRPDILKE